VIDLLCSDWWDGQVCCDWSTLLWLVRWPSLLWLIYSALIGQMSLLWLISSAFIPLSKHIQYRMPNVFWKSQAPPVCNSRLKNVMRMNISHYFFIIHNKCKYEWKLFILTFIMNYEKMYVEFVCRFHTNLCVHMISEWGPLF